MKNNQKSAKKITNKLSGHTDIKFHDKMTKVEMIDAYNYINYMYDNKKIIDIAKAHIKKEFKRFNLSNIPDSYLLSIGKDFWVWENLSRPLDILSSIEEKLEKLKEKFKEKEVSNRVKLEKVSYGCGLHSYVDEVFDRFLVDQKYKIDEKEFDEVVSQYVSALPALLVTWDQRIREYTKEDAREYFTFDEKRFTKELQFVSILVDKIREKVKETTKIKAEIKNKKLKARQPKKISPIKMTSKLQYMKSDRHLTSIAPDKIIGAKVLWLYNTKNKKLGRYVSDSEQGFMVKGSTLLNWDQKQSIQKSLRNPDNSLAVLMNIGKVEQRKFMDTLKTKESALTGRINQHTILMRVIN